MQNMIKSVVRQSKVTCIYHISKINIMVFSKTEINTHLHVRGYTIEYVTSMKYLGANVNRYCNPKKEIQK